MIRNVATSWSSFPRADGKRLVKRVIGLPGDEIAMLKKPVVHQQNSSILCIP